MIPKTKAKVILTLTDYNRDYKKIKNYLKY